MLNQGENGVRYLCVQRILLGGWIGKFKEGLRLRLVQRYLWQKLKFPLLSPNFASKQIPLDPMACQVFLE